MNWGLNGISWHFLIIFAWIAYLLVLFQILVDLLWRDTRRAASPKALWVIGLIFIPWLTALIYVIARGRA